MEWQSLHPTLFFTCAERRKFACSWPISWQLRQRLDDSAADKLGKRMILAGSADSACSLPGPWQASQPCHCGPSCFATVVFQCGPLSYPLATSSWHVLQVSPPTYREGSTGSWLSLATPGLLLSCLPAAALAFLSLPCLSGLGIESVASPRTSPNSTNNLF